MRVVTIIRQVPDAEARIRVAGGEIDLDGAGLIIDGMDEYGVEEALRLRDAGAADEVVALALGPARVEEALRTALAMGADRAVLIESEEELDPLSEALELARLVAEEQPGLVLVGGKQADRDSSALGPALAEALGWPHADWVTRLEASGEALSVTHDSDEGSEELRLPLPAVVTTQQGLNEPRYPTLPNIMKAKRKELRRLAAEGAAGRRTEVLAREAEQRERRRAVIEGDPEEAARELLRILRYEAGVLAR